MNICIAVPPVEDFYFTPHRFTIQGPDIVKRILQESGHNTNLLNFPLKTKKAENTLIPDELDYLKEFTIENESSRLSFFTKYKRWGKNFHECASEIKSTKPDIVFISCFAFAYADEAIKLAVETKKLLPEISIVMGGAGASALPEYFLDNPEIDFVLTGEAEVSVNEFIKAASGSRDLSSVPNLYYRKDSKVISPDLIKDTEDNDLDFNFTVNDKNKKKTVVTLSLSRGCLKNCSFCSNFICHGKEFRIVSTDKIKTGLDEIRTDKKIHFNFEDDNLLLKKDYFFECIELLKTKFHGCSFSAENGLDYMLLNKKDMEYLISKGFVQFNFSLASINRDILEKEKRQLNLEKISENTEIAEKYNIFSIIYFICGLKDDTKENVLETLIFLHKLPSISGISLFYPVPGLKDFTDKAKFENNKAFLCKGSSAFPWNKSLSTKEMVTAFRLSRLSNLVKEKNKKAIESELINIIFNTGVLHTIIKSGNSEKIVSIDNMDTYMVKYFLTRI